MLCPMILTETPHQRLYHSDKNKNFMLFTSLSARKYVCANIICLIYMPDRSVLKYTPGFTEWDCCQFLNLLSSILGSMASNVSLWVEHRGTHPWQQISGNGWRFSRFSRPVAECLYIQWLLLCSSVRFMMSLTLHALRVCDL